MEIHYVLHHNICMTSVKACLGGSSTYAGVYVRWGVRTPLEYRALIGRAAYVHPVTYTL